MTRTQDVIRETVVLYIVSIIIFGFLFSIASYIDGTDVTLSMLGGTFVSAGIVLFPLYMIMCGLAAYIVDNA